MRALVVFLSLGLLVPGCATDSRAGRERGGAGLFERASRVKGPRQDRCVAHGKSSVRSACDEARGLGQVYVRRLHPGDEVCLEGSFGEAPSGACQARAAVVNTGENEVLLEVREAQPNSRWFQEVQRQVWFEEGALVDLYLAERGY